MKARAGRAARSAGWALVLLLIGGHGAVLHPVGDSLAVFRWELSLGLMAVAALALALGSGGRIVAFFVIVAVGTGAPILRQQVRAGASVQGLTLYQKNIWVGNSRWAEVLADIRASGADVVTLQEVDRRHDGLVAALRESHPGWQRCGRGVHVFSRLPLAVGGGRCLDGADLPAALLEVETEEGPVWIVSVHLVWPWPWDQAGQAAQIAEGLGRLEGPMVIAGDFNMVPWGRSVRRIARAAGSAPLGPLVTTHRIDGLALPPLRIDHVLAPEGWSGQVEPRARLGSDHAGLVARVGR